MKAKNSSLEKKITKIIMSAVGGIAAATILIQGGLGLYSDSKYMKNLHSGYQQTTTIPKQYHVVAYSEGNFFHKVFDYDKDGVFDEVWINNGSKSICFKRKDLDKKYNQKYQQMFDSGNKVYISEK